MPSAMLAPHLQAFFADYLCRQKRLSPENDRQLPRYLPLIADVSQRPKRH